MGWGREREEEEQGIMAEENSERERECRGLSRIREAGGRYWEENAGDTKARKKRRR